MGWIGDDTTENEKRTVSHLLGVAVGKYPGPCDKTRISQAILLSGITWDDINVVTSRHEKV